MTGLMSFYQNHGDASETALPVDKWHPPFCGDIDMRIARDGIWFYNGTPIERPAMVRLFSRILRREDEAYFLVTPVEKVGIVVEDVPFIAVDMDAADGAIRFRTNVGDTVVVDAEHPLRFETDADGGFRPYIRVRSGLEARLSRQLAMDLIALAEVDRNWLGIRSGGVFFPIVSAQNLPD